VEQVLIQLSRILPQQPFLPKRRAANGRAGATSRPMRAGCPASRANLQRLTSSRGRSFPAEHLAAEHATDTHSDKPVAATVSIEAFGSWLLSFEKPVSRDEVARWLFKGDLPTGVVILAHGDDRDQNQQWDVSYGDWHKGEDAVTRMVQFNELLTDYGKDIANRALMGGELTPREAAEAKAQDEKISSINAVRNNQFIPALNMTGLEATEKLEPGVYELGGVPGKPNDSGYFVWLGYKTTDRQEPRLELQIVTKSDNELFNKDMRFWMSRGWMRTSRSRLSQRSGTISPT